MPSSTSKRSHLSPPGNPYKSSANVRQTQDQNYYPKAARILVIHSHFHSWGGSKNHRSDKLFPNVILSPRPWCPVKCYSLISYTMEWLHLGLFVVVLCLVFCEWADDIQVMPWRDSYHLCHQTREHSKSYAGKFKARLIWEGQDQSRFFLLVQKTICPWKHHQWKWEIRN